MNQTPLSRKCSGVKTIWPITHSCGHHAERDLSGRAADRRAGFAEWLAKQECTDCWRAAKEGDEQDKAAWLEAKRAEEQAESEAWSEQCRMPSLEGTDRAVAWGMCCRHQILAAAYTALVLEGETADGVGGDRGGRALRYSRRVVDRPALLRTRRPRRAAPDRHRGRPADGEPPLLTVRHHASTRLSDGGAHPNESPHMASMPREGRWHLPANSGRSKLRILRILFA